MKKIYTKIIIGLLTLSPVLAFAAEEQTVKTLAKTFIEYLNLGLYLIMALAFLVFVWNVFQYFFVEKEKGKEAGMYVLYSVIGFFVILSFWGIVAVVRNSIKLDDTPPSIVPIGIDFDKTNTTFNKNK